MHGYACPRANKATRAWSVEARVPFLDRRFIETAMTNKSEAMDLWKEIRDENAARSTVMHNSLIDTQARKGKVEGVGRLSVTIKNDGARVDAGAYSTMVKSHCFRATGPKH